MGALDFAGSGVVHLTGGMTALLATLVLGPRRGRFYDAQGEPLEVPKPFPGHSVALQLLGTMILWFGCKCSLIAPECIHIVANTSTNGQRLTFYVVFFDRVWIQPRISIGSRN